MKYEQNVYDYMNVETLTDLRTAAELPSLNL